MNGNFREILIFIAGSTPQVITETVYALSQKNTSIHPSEIFIITTAEGKRRILDALVERSILAQLCIEFGLPLLQVTDSSFLVIRDQHGNELDDIRDVESNEAAGDQIAFFLRQKSAEPNCRIHCVLGDGRKSMGYYMGMAFQLFARQWDRLYHVLVSPEFEMCDQFFYKPKASQKIEAQQQDGSVKTLETKDAEIALIELPLIFLRDKFSLSGAGVRDLVVQGQRKVSSATVQQKVEVNLADRQVRIGETIFNVPPMQLMIYAAFLRQKLRQTCDGKRTYCFECHGCFMHINDLIGRKPLQSLAVDYGAMHGGNRHKKEALLDRWKGGLFPDNVRQNISRFNSLLKRKLDDPILFPIYEIASDRKYANSRYGVRVEKENVFLR